LVTVGCGIATVWLIGKVAAHVAGPRVAVTAAFIAALAPNLWLLIGARALQGIGAAFLMTLSMALMRQTASEARVGQAMGLLGTVSALGTALGPSLGGLQIPAAGWRGIFWVQPPLAAIAMALAIARLPADPGKGKAMAPKLWLVLNRSLAPSLVLNLLVAAVMMTTLVVGPFYLARGLGLAEAAVGLVMSVGPLISIFSGVPSGRVVDAWGTQRVLAGGLALLAIGALLMAVLPQMRGVGGYVLAIVILTPGYQLFQAANNTAVLADVPNDRRGSVSGLLNLSRNTGLILGASAMSAIFAYGVGTEDLAHAVPPAIAAGMRLAFLMAGGMMVAAIVLAFRNPASTGRLP
jgi:MFS family permease